MKQQVKRVTLTGTIKKVSFDYTCGEYLVKNFSENDIYVSYENNTSDNEAVKIPSNSFQIVVANAWLGAAECFKSKDIYIKGTGEVEVQQLCYH